MGKRKVKERAYDSDRHKETFLILEKDGLL